MFSKLRLREGMYDVTSPIGMQNTDLFSANEKMCYAFY